MLKIIAFAATISTLCCGSAMSAEVKKNNRIKLYPVPRSSVLKEKGYIVWGASMVQSEDGTCHLFYCRWKGALMDWCNGAEIVHATASNPLGPYEPQKAVLGPTKEGNNAWDGLSVFNPTVMRFDDKYYLYYSGSNGSNFPIINKDGSFKTSPNDTVITQRIGVAVADHPAGPWKRMKDPLIGLSKDGIGSHMCCNPTVTQTPDDRFMMIYKCSSGRPRGNSGGIYLTVAFSDSPAGPFKKTQQKILTHKDSRFPVEDPFVWRQDDKYYCVADDQRGDVSGEHGLILFESEDGMKWQKSTPFVLSRCQIAWADGQTEPVRNFERPQIWLKDGKPAVLFAAIRKGEDCFNLHIPLQALESDVTKMKLTK
ncbi:MAG: glycoside hydrolase family protein [Planctomycetota bacterium]